MKKTFLSIIILLISLNVFSQNKKIIRKHFKEADFYLSHRDYLNALAFYQKIIALDSKNEDAHIYAAMSRLFLSHPLDSFKLHEYYLQKSKKPDSKFYLARIYHKKKNLDEALELYDNYLKVPVKKRMLDDDEIIYHKMISINAKEHLANAHRSIIKNMGPKINSNYGDYVPVITPDESALYFTSRREGSSDNTKDAYGHYHEDIYVAHKKNGEWQTPSKLEAPINTETNDACVAISPDAHRMIIYRASQDGLTGHLYITTLDEQNKWKKPVLLGNEINSQFTETSACFSNDTSEIYFSSNRPGGYGGKDIYRIKKLPNGKWGKPFNLGPTINTKYDEYSPFLHPDGVTLYFSSKGHNTMGEYDVFKSTVNSETGFFTEPINLGYPINDVHNDVFFVLNVNGQKAYYSSNKEDSYGLTDIYEIDTRFGDNDLMVKHGVLFKNDSLGKAKITLLDNETNKVAGIYNSNAKTGKFILIMNP
ncbi:MAG: hypothetical protein AB7O73_03240, partial [Bacteroidia bacterium]